MLNHINQCDRTGNMVGPNACPPALRGIAGGEKRAKQFALITSMQKPSVMIKPPDTFPFTNGSDEILISGIGLLISHGDDFYPLSGWGDDWILRLG